MSLSNPSGEEIARMNEAYIIRECRHHHVIREDDLSIILNWSIQMVQRTVKRLVKDGEVIRMRVHGAYFVALKKRDDTIKLPATWKHDALAISVSGHIRDQYPSATIETEARIRERIQLGKIPDGIVAGSGVNIRIEVELSHKSSHPMEKQSKEAVVLAQQGVTTIFAYPYPPNEYFLKHDWEHRIASAVRDVLNHDNAEPYIKLLRCYMTKRVHLDHCRPHHFELIDLPPMPANSRIGQGKPKLGTEIIQGHHWKRKQFYSENHCSHQIWELFFDNHRKGTFKFIESLSFADESGEAHQMLMLNERLELVPSRSFPMNQAYDPFPDFVEYGKLKAEKLDMELMQQAGELPVEIPKELD
jgi:hypothetical protein